MARVLLRLAIEDEVFRAEDVISSVREEGGPFESGFVAALFEGEGLASGVMVPGGSWG